MKDEGVVRASILCDDSAGVGAWQSAALDAVGHEEVLAAAELVLSGLVSYASSAASS